MHGAKTVIVFCLFATETLSKQCVTPNGEKAECKSLYRCPVLIGALATQQDSAIEFVKRSKCGGECTAEPMVCCGTSFDFIGKPNRTASENSGKHESRNSSSLLPSRRFCGYQHADDYNHSTNDTAINEFPWLGLMLYRYFPDYTKFYGKDAAIDCSGSLINNRYVLTSVTCTRLQYRTLIGVRLGEYNLLKDKDCTEDSDLEECSDPVEEYGVEEIVRHPGYSLIPELANDVALLRLNRQVIYSDYIRPICLPTPGFAYSKIGDTLVTSGWDRGFLHNHTKIDIKKRIFNERVDLDVCRESYQGFRRYLGAAAHICTVEFANSGEFVCEDDRGGPVMFSYRNQWYQEGIISWVKGCGKRASTINSGIMGHLEWIERNMRL